MITSRGVSVIAWAILALAAVSAHAKRIPQRPVAPVTGGGFVYSASGDGADQYVVATEASTGKELWKVKVFHNYIRFWMEPDVQFIYITNLKLTGNFLFFRDERSRCYSIDLAKRSVKKKQCGDLSSLNSLTPSPNCRRQGGPKLEQSEMVGIFGLQRAQQNLKARKFA